MGRLIFEDECGKSFSKIVAASREIVLQICENNNLSQVLGGEKVATINHLIQCRYMMTHLGTNAEFFFSIYMTNELIFSIIERRFSDAILAKEESYGMLSVTTTREKIVPVLEFLRDDKHLDFNFLTSLATIHYPQNLGNELCMVYHLHSFLNNKRIRVKVNFPIADPHCPSIVKLWEAANWMERQEYDFFGVIFDGHPNLKRILNVDDMEVFPMRKEYRLEDGTRTDKDDRFFGREGHVGRSFD